jgi:hypothetical protein
MTQVEAVSATQPSERIFTIHLKPRESERAGMLNIPLPDGVMVRKFTFISLKNLPNCAKEIVIPASLLLHAVSQASFDLVLKSQQIPEDDPRAARKALTTIREQTRGILSPLERFFWQQHWLEQGGQNQALTSAYGPYFLEHLAQLQASPEFIGSLAQILMHDSRVCRAGMAEWYGPWFWPNISNLCLLTLSKVPFETLLGRGSLDTYLNPLKQLMFEDGNIPLGITRDRVLHILTA